MTLLVNTANILFVLGYFTLDLLRLRLLSVIATSCLAVYFASQPEPMLNVVAWNLFFVALNLVQLVRLLRARRRERPKVRHGPISGGPTRRAAPHPLRNLGMDDWHGTIGTTDPAVLWPLATAGRPSRRPSVDAG